MTPCDDLKERYRASMLLSAAGDALGYKNQEWEYCKSGKCRSSDAEMSSDQDYCHIDLLILRKLFATKKYCDIRCMCDCE